MSQHMAPEKPGNFVHQVITCNSAYCRGPADGCTNTWDLGIVGYYHPNPLRRTWWRIWGKPRATRRIAAFNRHTAILTAREAAAGGTT